VIAFVAAVSDPERYEAHAAAGVERVREPDSRVMAIPCDGPPQPGLNAALDELAGLADLEAAVLLHEDVHLLDLDTAAIVRRAFGDPRVAVAGPIGARGVDGLAWWEGHGVGHCETPHMPGGAVWGVESEGPVDALDGIVLCLSPWAVRTLRFADYLSADFHGYDVDLCFQARHHGREVRVIELAVRHEHGPLFRGTDRWIRNELRFRHRWFDRRYVSQRHHASLSHDEEPAPGPPG
jgi:hypothetical protein